MCTEIFNAVLNHFKTLPATGKPQAKEHTVLAGSLCTAATLHVQCCRRASHLETLIKQALP